MDRGVASKRKLIGFDAETWQAIDLFSRASVTAHEPTGNGC
jgi:hypothetical protein